MSKDNPSQPWQLLVANNEQLLGSRIVRVEGGSGDGARLLEVWTPAGLHLEFTLDRAMDLPTVRHNGRPVSWLGPPGLRTRHQFEPLDFGWLRTFHGGLVMTCGLEHFGNPVTRDGSQYAPPDDRKIHYGEHGRVSHESASLIRCEVVDGEDPHYSIVASVNQASLYGDHYHLRREYRVSLARAAVTLTDIVTNTGPLPTRHMLLYHFNFGYPLVDDETRYEVSTATGSHRGTAQGCRPAAPEQVDTFEPGADANGLAHAWIENGPAGMRVALDYATESLPVMFVWTLPRDRANVVGFAPASVAAPDEASLLDAGATRRYSWSLEFATLK